MKFRNICRFNVGGKISQSITENGSQCIIGNNNVINGKKINAQGKSVQVINNQVIVDGKPITKKSDILNVTIEGNCEKLSGVTGDIVIKGNCGDLKDVVGDIKIDGSLNGAFVSGVVGDVTIGK